MEATVIRGQLIDVTSSVAHAPMLLLLAVVSVACDEDGSVEGGRSLDHFEAAGEHCKREELSIYTTDCVLLVRISLD